jgi:endonuclease/exonuclease/phosphatase family metal-dependent hydrolase
VTRTFSISSFNTRWGMTVEDVPFDLAGVLDQLDTDVIALQEVWDPADGSGALGPAAEEHGYAVLHVPMAASFVAPRPEITADLRNAEGTWGVALLSRLPVRRTRLIDLGRMFERWDVACRYAMLAELDVDEHLVIVAAHHLSFAMPNALAQIRRLGGAIPSHLPSVVAGDCNMWGPLAVRALGRHRRAVRGRTWPAQRPHSQLDHLLVSADIDVSDARVLPAVGSDHLPIRATLTLR